MSAFDPRVSNLIELFSEYGFAIRDDYPELDDRENIAHKIVVLAENYGFDAGFLVAVCRYEDEHIKAAKRLDHFHVETGLTLADEDLPRVWDDLDRVIFVLNWVSGLYKDNVKDALAYYLIGDRYFPSNGYDELNDEMKETIEQILDDADLYQNLIMAPRGPDIIEVDDTEADPNSDWPEYPYFTDDETRDAYVSVILYYNPNLDKDTADLIFDAIAINAGEYPDIDARLIMALVACESSFNPEAVSRCGALGLGQLMPFTALKHGVNDPFDVMENIRATYEYMQNEFERWEGYNHIYDYVLASYNAGHGAVEKYAGIPPYKETINYVYRVTRVYKNFLKEEEYKDKIYGKSKHYPEKPPR